MEILGLLDTLESMILDGSKVPFSKKVIIDEEKVLAVVDKIRLVAQGGGGFAKDAIASKINAKAAALAEQGQTNREQSATVIVEEESNQTQSDDAKAVEVLQEAYQLAKEIREGADKYADEVLANLESTSTRILRTVKAGRERLVK